MAKGFVTIRLPADLADRIRSAIAAKRSHAFTVDEFLRHWIEQVLLGLTADYVLHDDPRMDAFTSLRLRTPGRRGRKRRTGGPADALFGTYSRRPPESFNLSKPLIEDIERAIDLHQTTIPNRTRFTLACAEYGLLNVNLPRNRGLEAVLLPPHLQLPPDHRFHGGPR